MANQPAGCYTPTPGGSTMYHNQAGDLHTPNLGFQLGTPLSLPTSEAHAHQNCTAFALQGFHPHLLGSTTIPAPATFSQQQSYAPSSFIHQDSGFETIGGSHEVTSKQGPRMDVDRRRGGNNIPFPIKTFSTGMPVAVAQSTEK